MFSDKTGIMFTNDPIMREVDNLAKARVELVGSRQMGDPSSFTRLKSFIDEHLASDEPTIDCSEEAEVYPIDLAEVEEELHL